MTAGPRRSRSRNGKQRSGNSAHSSGIRPQTVFTSHGPDGRVRGTAAQIYDKYLSLAQDAMTSNDKVLGEGFYQHAEHYARLVNKMNAQREDARRSREESDALNQEQPDMKIVDEASEPVAADENRANDQNSDANAEGNSKPRRRTRSRKSDDVAQPEEALAPAE